ncbi:MAG: thioredoxin-dependent thiol peroxidase [Cytophagales bacterium]|nr:thioredoxin-dependent thiol peroxidase [Cytophagales bacterium]
MKLAVGDQAPDFVSKDQNEDSISLSDFKGKKIILYFYPRDNTPGCTAESCNLRDNYSHLQKQGYVVLGISSNDQKSHQKFIKKYDLPFPLIADTDKSVHEAYGTWAPKKFMGREFLGTVRTTFVIDEEGKIEEIIEKVKTKDHTAQILG